MRRGKKKEKKRKKKTNSRHRVWKESFATQYCSRWLVTWPANPSIPTSLWLPSWTKPAVSLMLIGNKKEWKKKKKKLMHIFILFLQMCFVPG
jgi:hypothetical protein